MELVQSPLTVADLASYPGPAQLSVACSTGSDGKLGGARVRGKLDLHNTTHTHTRLIHNLSIFLPLLYPYTLSIFLSFPPSPSPKSRVLSLAAGAGGIPRLEWSLCFPCMRIPNLY